MTTRNNKKNKKKINAKASNYTGFIKSRSFKWTIIGTVIIVVIVLVAIFNPFFSAPTSISPDSYYKVSQGDLLSNGTSAVFFLSWIGCPIGATDSWAIYYGINSTTNIYNHVTLHTADPEDIYSSDTTGQPGLIFNGNFTFTYSGHKFAFYPLYMYNESMTGTATNKSLTTAQLIPHGLSLINNTYPAKVAAIFNKYSADIEYSHHLTTTILITGSHGTYIINSYMYSPVSGGILGSGTSGHGTWNPNPPEYVISRLDDSKTIKTAGGTFLEYLGKAQ